MPRSRGPGCRTAWADSVESNGRSGSVKKYALAPVRFRPGRNRASPPREPADSGCVGPKAVRYTRLRYNEVIRDTNDEQLLINLRASRYADSPVFIDLPKHHQPVRGGRPGQLHRGRRQPVPGPDEPRRRRAVLRDTPTLSYHPREGRGDRQGAADPPVGRPVQRRQCRGRPRAALVADHQRHQRRAERPRATTLAPKVPDDNALFLRGIRLLRSLREREAPSWRSGRRRRPRAPPTRSPGARSWGGDLPEMPPATATSTAPGGRAG